MREVASIADRIVRLGVAMSQPDDASVSASCAPDRVIRRCRSVLRRVAHPFELGVTVAPGGRIEMAADALERVAINLIRNARAAVNERGRIDVSVSRVGGRRTTRRVCVLAVTDTGGPVRPSTGPGLGLHIVEELVGNAGGNVEVLTGEGPGWTVRCAFPDVG